jgi:hypothetical protein
MSELTFAVSLLLPSMVFCYVVLSTFCGWIKAYLAISWIPLTMFLILRVFLQMEYVQNFHSATGELLLATIKWVSALQGLLGIAILGRALYVREEWVIPAIATMITILPFFLTP